MKLVALLVAHLHLAGIFTDNMVLQRGLPVHIWGKGVPGKKLTGVLGHLHAATVIGKDSTWDLYYPAQQADSTGRTLSIVSGNENIRLNNILIGDVWLCLGQSNMEFPMKSEMHFAQEKAETDQPLIRLYNPTYIGKNTYATPYTDSMVQRLTAGKFYQGTWLPCDSLSVKTMSAVGYYFGKMIVDKEHVPIGLIHLAIGGCPIETFMSRDALKEFPEKLAGNWLKNGSIPEWVRERGLQNLGGKNIDTVGPNHAYKPGFAFKEGIDPLLPMPVKGIIWYQGESNAQEPERVEEYPRLQQAMVNDYRKKWRQPHLPVYWVQLSSIDTAHYKSLYWPVFRDGQRRLLKDIPNSGMAVSSDIGFRDNVHPTNKKAVGERLARWALHDLYGEHILPSGPLPLKATYRHDTVTIHFMYAQGLHTSDSASLRGFSFDGTTAAPAFIRGDTVILAVKERPSTLYYAWQPYTDANLVNADELPASTFKLNIP